MHHRVPARVVAALVVLALVAVTLARIVRRQAAIRDSRRLYRAIARNIPHGIVAVFDRSMRMLFVDGQGLDEIGLTREEVEGGSPAAWPTSVRPILEAEFERALAGIPTTAEFTLGGRVYLLHAIPLPDHDGHVDRGLMLAEDVTLLIQMQDELEEAKRGLEEANERLRQMSETDSLLGIANRRKFDAILAVEWRRAIREGMPISLLMIDVDFFKAFNDAYGHQKGDECLRSIGQAVAGTAQRPGDLAARYGGEELVALLPGTGAEGALEMAERIHDAVAVAAITHCDSRIAPCVTVSIGTASCVPAEGMCADDLILAADEAVYDAKNAGRNRTCAGVVVTPGHRERFARSRPLS